MTDADLPIFFDLQRDLTYNHMAAFTHKDPDDRAAFDAHWKKIRANPENKNQTIRGGCASPLLIRTPRIDALLDIGPPEPQASINARFTGR